MRVLRETRFVIAALMHAIFAMLLLLYVVRDGSFICGHCFFTEMLVTAGAVVILLYFLMRYLMVELLSSEYAKRLSFFSAGGMLMAMLDLGYWSVQCLASWLALKWMMKDIGCTLSRCDSWCIVSCFALFLGLATFFAFRAVRYDIKNLALMLGKDRRSSRCDPCESSEENKRY